LSPRRIKEYGIFDEGFVARFLGKFAKRQPEQLGYRDNMLLIFMLSTQMALYWARNPRSAKLDESLRTVDLVEQEEVGNGRK
jgi:asparagine synthase (glutamine-hydrolysing)